MWVTLALDTNKSSTNDQLARIKAIHSVLRLAGEPGKDLLKAPDEALLYLISILHDKPVKTPDLSPQQWAELIGALNPLWILPLLFCKAREISDESRPPKEVVDILRKEYLRSTKHSILLDRQLKEMIYAFNEENIRVIFLKGSALSRSVYPDPAMRPCTDIDLLVLPEDVARSGKVLEHLGYECNTKYFDSMENFYCEEAYSRNDKNYRNVEIHWALNPFSMVHDIDIKQLFERAVNVTYQDLSFDTLDPVDTLVHLSMHMVYGHSDNIHLNWIYDIHQVCGIFGKDEWDILQKRCIQYGARIPIEYALNMAQYWTGLTIPFNFDDWPSPTKTDRKAFDHIVKGHDNTMSQFKLLWPGNATFPEKIKVLFYLVFPAPDVIRASYPPPYKWLLPASYIKRWFTLILGLFK